MCLKTPSSSSEGFIIFCLFAHSYNSLPKKEVAGWSVQIWPHQRLRKLNLMALFVLRGSGLMWRTWKNAIPKEMPAMIPRLDSITLVTNAKQPYTAEKHQFTECRHSHQSSQYGRRSTHRRVHLCRSLVQVFKGLLWALGVFFTAADRDAFLFEILCLAPVSVVFHPTAMQLQRTKYVVVIQQKTGSKMWRRKKKGPTTAGCWFSCNSMSDVIADVLED